MQLIAPPAPAPTPAAPDSDLPRRAPSVLQVPNVDDGSTAASASLDQVASYVGMLNAALGDDVAFYQQLVRRGFLDSAIDYARYSLDLLDSDRLLDNDAFSGMVEGAVLNALLAARNIDDPGDSPAFEALTAELQMAQAGATNAARSLLALGTRPDRA